jgi:uncharacterized membrane protein
VHRVARTSPVVRTSSNGDGAMTLLAHGPEGHGWGGPFQPWEFHPALNHLPIAFLLAAVALELYATFRDRLALLPTAFGLLAAGVLAALAGVLAFFTVPAHTDESHQLMFWHMGVQATALVLFAGVAWKRRRNRAASSAGGRLVLCLAAIALLAGSAIGGYIVYHGAAGVDPKLLAPEVRESHSHGSDPTEHSDPTEPSG